MTSQNRADWRPPVENDWRRLRTLLRDVAIHLATDAELFDQAQKDLRWIGEDKGSIGIGRYREHAERCRRLADLVDDELGALEGGHQRTVPLDDRGMFPGTMAP